MDREDVTHVEHVAEVVCCVLTWVVPHSGSVLWEVKLASPLMNTDKSLHMICVRSARQSPKIS